MMVVHHALHVPVWYGGGNSEYLVYKVVRSTDVKKYEHCTDILYFIFHRYGTETKQQSENAS